MGNVLRTATRIFEFSDKCLLYHVEKNYIEIDEEDVDTDDDDNYYNDDDDDNDNNDDDDNDDDDDGEPGPAH